MLYTENNTDLTLVRRGRITNYLLIAYSFSNTSAKNYENRLMCIEVIVCNVSVVFFETQCLGQWKCSWLDEFLWSQDGARLKSLVVELLVSCVLVDNEKISTETSDNKPAVELQTFTHTPLQYSDDWWLITVGAIFKYDVPRFICQHLSDDNSTKKRHTWILHNKHPSKLYMTWSHVFISSVLAKKLAGKNISKMTYFVSSGT